MKVYEPSGGGKLIGSGIGSMGNTVGEEDEEADETMDDYDLRHVAKESHIPNHTVST